MMPGPFRAIVIAFCLVGVPSIVTAQAVEVAPFAGYRFGGDFFEIVTGQPVDLDGAPAFGAAVDVPLSNGLQLEGLFSHQDASVSVPTEPFGPPTRWHITVDHWQGGGLQELADGRIRPFLTGTLGLTRYAGAGDDEERFTLGAGGGVKLFPWSRVGLRLDGRVFATFVDGDGSVIACSPGFCIVALHADVVWQAEFTAGAVIRFH